MESPTFDIYSSNGDFLENIGNEDRSTIEEDGVSIQLVLKDKKKCLFINPDVSWYKIAAMVLNTGIFATAGSLMVIETLGMANISKLTVYNVLTGASLVAFFAEIFQSDVVIKIPKYLTCNLAKKSIKIPGKELNRFVCAWSYESVFAFTQEYKNIPGSHTYYTLPFIYALGVLKTKDIITLLSMQHSDFELSPSSLSTEESIKTLGFNTRDYSCYAKMWLAATVVTSVALTALNFTIIPIKDEYGEIGLYQSLIAMYSGSVLGDLAARLYEYIQAQFEKKHSDDLIESPKGNAYKKMRIAKTIFALFTPIAVNLIFSIRTDPNTLPDYFAKLGVGGIYGANLLISRGEFENKASSFHRIKFTVYDQEWPFAEKAKAVAKKYFPSLAYYGLLIGYMAWVASTNSAKADYGILAFLTATLLSFVTTDCVAMWLHPKRENRIANELVFRLLYCFIPLCICYQLLAKMVKIGNQELDESSPYLYALQLVEWCSLGFNFGNNRGVYIQPTIPGVLPITSPLAMTELTKPFINNLYLYFNK